MSNEHYDVGCSKVFGSQVPQPTSTTWLGVWWMDIVWKSGWGGFLPVLPFPDMVDLTNLVQAATVCLLAIMWPSPSPSPRLLAMMWPLLWIQSQSTTESAFNCSRSTDTCKTRPLTLSPLYVSCSSGCESQPSNSATRSFFSSFDLALPFHVMQIFLMFWQQLCANSAWLGCLTFWLSPAKLGVIFWRRFRSRLYFDWVWLSLGGSVNVSSPEYNTLDATICLMFWLYFNMFNVLTPRFGFHQEARWVPPDITSAPLLSATLRLL